MRQAFRRWWWLGVILIAGFGFVACLSLGFGIVMLTVARPAPTPAPMSANTDTPPPSATTTLTPTPSITPAPGETVRPTKTPKPPTKTPRPARPIRKIGPEIYGATHTDLGSPPVIKLRNPAPDYTAELRQEVGPDTLIVIRFENDEPSKDTPPQQAAREWYARYRDQMLTINAQGQPNVAFETAINECPEEWLDWYVSFSLDLIPLMHADGLRVVAGNPAVGQWSEQGWPKFKPVLDALNANDFLGLHEYWVDTADLANVWHVGRWRIPAIAAVLGDVKIVVTECGRDVVEGRGKAGWRQSADQETFLWELEEYDIILRDSPNVVGATAFTIDPNWDDFNLFDTWPQVVRRYSITPTPTP